MGEHPGEQVPKRRCLEEAMIRLKDHFQLDDHDLDLGLGPLGPLLPEG